MHTQRPVAVLLLAFAVTVGCSGPLASDTATQATAQSSLRDEAAVRATLHALESAWNRHEIGEFHGLLTEEVHWVVGNGNCWRSRQAVCDAYETLHAAIAASSDPNPLATLRIDSIEVRFPTPQIATGIATLRFGTTPHASTTDASTDNTRASFVMISRGRSWQIAQFHQSPFDPSIERADPVWGGEGADRGGGRE